MEKSSSSSSSSREAAFLCPVGPLSSRPSRPPPHNPGPKPPTTNPPPTSFFTPSPEPFTASTDNNKLPTTIHTQHHLHTLPRNSHSLYQPQPHNCSNPYKANHSPMAWQSKHHPSTCKPPGDLPTQAQNLPQPNPPPLASHHIPHLAFAASEQLHANVPDIQPTPPKPDPTTQTRPHHPKPGHTNPHHPSRIPKTPPLDPPRLWRPPPVGSVAQFLSRSRSPQRPPPAP